jgi:hypothetical protein
MIIDGMRFVFIGIVDKDDNIPNINCVYCKNMTGRNVYELQELTDKGIINKNIGPLIIHRKEFKPILKAGAVIIDPSSEYSNNPLSDKPLRLTVYPEDDEIMVLMKKLLIRDKVTVSQYHKIYMRGEEDNIVTRTRMNNDKHRLENGDSLSWRKASSLIKKMGYKYELNIYDDNEMVVNNNTDYKQALSEITANESEDKPLKISITDDDDEIMVIMKLLLLRDKITVAQYKEIYMRGEDETLKDTQNRMNNDKFRLENGASLSWKKGSSLIKKMGYKYELHIYNILTNKLEVF